MRVALTTAVALLASCARRTPAPPSPPSQPAAQVRVTFRERFYVGWGSAFPCTAVVPGTALPVRCTLFASGRTLSAAMETHPALTVTLSAAPTDAHYGDLLAIQSAGDAGVWTRWHVVGFAP